MPTSIASRASRIVACCSIVFILGSVLEINSAADELPRKFDEFTGAGWEDAMARLDNFALNLRDSSSAVGIIIVYGGQDRRRGEAQAWSSCIRDYLEKRRGLDANRIVMVQGGYKQRLTGELWILPDRTNLPRPTPEIKPSEVRFKGRAIKQWRRLCSGV
jgi:hypothetical protein